MSTVASPVAPRRRLLAVGGRVSPRVRARRAALGSLLVVVLALLALLALRGSSAFAVDAVRVRGVHGRTAAAVSAEARRLVAGRSLLALDPRALERDLAALPFVRSVRVDRAFPQTLAVRVTPETPAAVVVSGSEALTVARSGRVMARTDAARRRSDLPLLAAAVLPERPGGRIADPAVLTELAVANAVPPGFGFRLATVQAGTDGLRAVTRRGLRIELGDAADLGAKLLAARAVAAAATTNAPRVIDVTVPSLPAVSGADPDTATLGQSGDAAGVPGPSGPTGEPDLAAVVADLFVSTSISG